MPSLLVVVLMKALSIAWWSSLIFRLQITEHLVSVLHFSNCMLNVRLSAFVPYCPCKACDADALKLQNYLMWNVLPSMAVLTQKSGARNAALDTWRLLGNWLRGLYSGQKTKDLAYPCCICPLCWRQSRSRQRTLWRMWSAFVFCVRHLFLPSKFKAAEPELSLNCRATWLDGMHSSLVSDLC